IMLAFVVALGASNALANTFANYTLSNINLSGFIGPYATVQVDLNVAGTSATITFDSLTNGGYKYLLIDGGSAAVNVNGAFTLGTISGTVASGTGFTQATYSNGGAGNEDGFGNFNLTINSFDGFKDASQEIVFTLTNNSGTWSDASTVLTLNGGGSVAAAHVAACTDPCTNQAAGAVNTGFAANGAQVPEASSTLLLSLALLGVVVVSRKLAPARV